MKEGVQSIDAVSMILGKRGGHRHSKHEIKEWIEAYANGSVPDYQMAAWAMAVFFRGLSLDETIALTLAMRDSGIVLSSSSEGDPHIPRVDKHSTGGVGDKVSICLMPWVASCGLRVPSVAGRGLGHSGGTIDKLEAIDGYRSDLSLEEFSRIVDDVGCAIMGQTSTFTPADKKLYALRDVTGTVESIPLITASILSKKLAEGLDALVLDVKAGRGAFMQTVEEAESLAKMLVQVGEASGVRTRAVLTKMEAPLGKTIGNALEVGEAFSLLRGESTSDLYLCTRTLAVEMLVAGGVASSAEEALSSLETSLQSGDALKTARRWIAAQGGNPAVVDDDKALPQAAQRVEVCSPSDGFVHDIDARAVAEVALDLGAGRKQLGDAIDPAVGIVLEKKPGSSVARGEVLACIHAQGEGERFAEELLSSFHIEDGKPETSSADPVITSM